MQTNLNTKKRHYNYILVM